MFEPTSSSYRQFLISSSPPLCVDAWSSPLIAYNHTPNCKSLFLFIFNVSIKPSEAILAPHLASSPIPQKSLPKLYQRPSNFIICTRLQREYRLECEDEEDTFKLSDNNGNLYDHHPRGFAALSHNKSKLQSLWAFSVFSLWCFVNPLSQKCIKQSVLQLVEVVGHFKILSV